MSPSVDTQQLRDILGRSCAHLEGGPVEIPTAALWRISVLLRRRALLLSVELHLHTAGTSEGRMKTNHYCNLI